MRLLIFVLSLMVFTNAAKAASPIEGLWLTENKRSVIKIEPCEENSLCGSVYWIIEGGLQKDIHNPDAALRTRPMCGLKIMWDFEQESETEWEDGTIYKADEGDRYNADIKLLDDGRLKLRGYLGFTLFGKTQYWTRVKAADYRECREG